MNRIEKQALASMLIGEVGTMLEHWKDKIESHPEYEILRSLDYTEASQVVANWLQHLPGESWHSSLPEPKRMHKG